MTTEHAGGERRAPRFAYQPALDGVRGVAVAMVLCFHAGFGWMSGGYVGVSVFFTLSGYLITSLALAEHASSGRVDVGAFYGRRVRRLLPASACCLVGVVVLASIGVFEQVPNLRRDLWAALAQVYNWVALASGTSYQEQVDAAAGRLAPLDHYWSLAIEEQFYWVWPLVLAAALPRLRTASSRVGAIVAISAVSVVAAPLIAAVWGPDAAYWATPARFGEILVGATLAVIAHERRRRHVVDAPGIRWLAVGGLAAVVLAAVTWPAGTGPAYAGLLPLFAVASAALIAGLQVESPLRRAFEWSPLVALGTISYGVYLYHWPVYAALDPVRVDLPVLLLFTLRVVVTLALAVVSYIGIERPVRIARPAPGRVAGLALSGTVVVAVLIAVVVPAGRGGYWLAGEEERAAAAFAPLGPDVDLVATVPVRPAATTPVATTTVAASRPDPASTTVTAPPLPDSLTRPVRILVVGDSTASATGTGLVMWAASHPSHAQVDVRWGPGCGFLQTGFVPGMDVDFVVACERMHGELTADLATLAPDVVMLMSTPADLSPRVLDGDTAAIGPSDPDFVTAMRSAYRRFLRQLIATGVRRVAWVSPPTPGPFGDARIERESYDVLRSVIREVAADHPDVVTVVELDRFDEQHPEFERPDSLHYTPESAVAVAEQYLGPLLVSVALA